MEDGFDDAEQTFLSRARRYKNNDGKIDQNERNELVELAMRLGLSSVRREYLLELAESEYEKEHDRFRRGDSSDGKNRRFAFLDWRRWRKGPLQHVRRFVGTTRNKMSDVGIERPDDNLALGGVCAAICNRFGLNCKLMRIVVLAVGVLCPFLMPLYFVFWSLIPIKGERFVE